MFSPMCFVFLTEEPTPASPHRDDLEGPDMVEGLDQFATSLGLTPRRLLSHSPVTPPSAFLPEKRSSTTARQQQGKPTPYPFLPSSNILMKALQQPNLSHSGPGDASCSTSSTVPLSDVSANSSGKPSKGVNNSFDKNDEALTSVGDIKRAATMPTLEEIDCKATTMPTLETVCKLATMPTLEDRTVSVSTSSIALSSSPSLQGDDVASKQSSPIITTSIPADSRKASFSKGEIDNSASKHSNSSSLEHTSAACESAQRAQNGSVALNTKVSDETNTLTPLTTKKRITKNSESSSSSGSCASPCTSAVSSKLSKLPTTDCLSPGRLASNNLPVASSDDLCDEASVGSKCIGKMTVACLEVTPMSSSVDSGVVGSKSEVKAPSGSGDEQKTIEVSTTNIDDSVAQRNGNI